MSPDLGAADPRERLVRVYFEVLASGDVARLEGVLAPDYVDLDSLEGWPPGATGVSLKLLLFRASYPDAAVVIDSLLRDGDSVRVTWRTTARGLGERGAVGTWRYVAVFDVGGRIRSSRVLEAAPA